MVPSEIYRELEAQILENLREGDLDQLGHLIGDHDLEIELLSGEWRVMMQELEDYYQVIDLKNRIARMVVGPDELAAFVRQLRDPDRQARWSSLSFGLAELTDALPVDTDLVAVVFTEETDDWLWAEPVYELVAIRPEVFELLEPHLRAQMASGDFRSMARLAEDHSEGSVEFSPEQWRVLMRHSQERVPELLAVYEQRLSKPGDYTQIREALTHVADPRFQPSLDAWLRVHAHSAQYALYFRDSALERKEFEGSGLLRIGRNTQKMKVVPAPGELPPPPAELPSGLEDELDDLEAAGMSGQTVPLKIAERDRIARNTDPRNKDE
jgi:hypothetical protein